MSILRTVWRTDPVSVSCDLKSFIEIDSYAFSPPVGTDYGSIGLKVFSINHRTTALFHIFVEITLSTTVEKGIILETSNESIGAIYVSVVLIAVVHDLDQKDIIPFPLRIEALFVLESTRRNTDVSGIKEWVGIPVRVVGSNVRCAHGRMSASSTDRRQSLVFSTQSIQFL
ncbi:MAG: hypothetical protein WD846_03350 [Patescibacteria group bacterium]